MAAAMKIWIFLQSDQISCVGVFYYLKEAKAEIKADSNPFPPHWSFSVGTFSISAE